MEEDENTRLYRRRVVLVGVLCVLLVGTIAWVATLLGFLNISRAEFGYYGHFNHARRIIDSIPGVVIVSSWQHRDVSLEDFGFELLVNETQRVQVAFPEGSRQMALTDDKRLQEFIQGEIELGRH